MFVFGRISRMREKVTQDAIVTSGIVTFLDSGDPKYSYTS